MYQVLTNPCGLPLEWKAASWGQVPVGGIVGGHEGYAIKFGCEAHGGYDGRLTFVGRAVGPDGVKYAGKIIQKEAANYRPHYGTLYYAYQSGERQSGEYEALIAKKWKSP